MENEGDVFISDSAKTDPASDRFKRYPFAQRIAQALTSRTDSDSIVIGIYGAWGEGKTTVLHFIENELKKHDDVISVWFNPWRFEDEVQLLRNFFGTLADAIQGSLLSRKERVGEWLKEYGAGLLGIFSFKVGDQATGGQAEFSLRDAAKEIGTTLSSVELDELRNRIGKLLREEGKRIVVFMDDIDRLDRAEIQTVFKLVKLSADFANTAYVLAFDEEIVASSLAEKYASGKKKEGRRFLEKIVQVPLYIPKADGNALRTLALEGVDKSLKGAQIDLTKDDVEAFVIHFNNLIPRLQTPRMAKRYTNALAFSLPIFKGEVNIVDVLLLEGIRVFYPNIFTTIRDSLDVFVGERFDSLKDKEKLREKNENVIASAMKGLTDVEAEAAREVLNFLFTNISDGRGYWLRKDEDNQRVSSREYLRRYFSYAIPEDDVSDTNIKDLVEGAANSEVENIVSKIKEIMGSKAADAFMWKLKAKAKGLSADVSSKLAPALARVGESFSRPKKEIFFATGYYHAAVTVSFLLDNIPSGIERYEAARVIIQEGEPLSFAAECFAKMLPREGKQSDRELFPTEERQTLGRIMADRIGSYAATEILYTELPRDAQFLLSLWSVFGSRDETNKYIITTIQQALQNVVDFLKCYLPIEGASAKEIYNSISQVVDPDVIYDALKQLYGSNLDTVSYNSYDNLPRDKSAAYQFANIYRTITGTDQPITEAAEVIDLGGPGDEQAT
jgi:hypothetical protein